MAIQFTKATKKKGKLRLAFDGPAGAGKTYTALAVACGIAKRIGSRVALIDTERGSASLYGDEFDFDVVELDEFAPDTYVQAIHHAQSEGYGVIVIDSLSHAWEGKGGALDMKDRAAQKSGNDWTAWRSVTPAHNRLVDAMLQCPAHVIVTMRTKMEYVQEKDERGKTVIRKVGMAPVQRNGMEYEFTVVGDIDTQHVLTISKSRCKAIDNEVIARPGDALAKTLIDWLNSGAEASASASAPVTPAARVIEQPPPVAAAPAATATSAAEPANFAAFADKIRSAKSARDLAAIGGEIHAAVKAGSVTQDERARLVAIYTEHLARVPAEAA